MPAYPSTAILAGSSRAADLIRFNGQTLMRAKEGRHFGILAVDGQVPPSVRDTTGAAPPTPFVRKVK